MGELDIQIKVLKRRTPVLFTWLNKDTYTIEGYIVTCPCQNLGLKDSSSMKTKKAERSHHLPNLHNEIPPMNLAKALQAAEIVTISKGAETGSSLWMETSCHKRRYERPGRERKMGRDGDDEKKDVDKYRGRGGGLEGGGGDQEGDKEVVGVGSMSVEDDSDIDTDQVDGEDAEEDSEREDSERDFKMKEENIEDNSEEDGTNVRESIEVSDSCKESQVSCEWTCGARQRGEGEMNVKNEGSLKWSADDVQQLGGDHLEDDSAKDLPQGGDKMDSTEEDKSALTQTDTGAQGENEGSHLRDNSFDSRQGVSLEDSLTDGAIIPSSYIEKEGVTETKEDGRLQNAVDEEGADDPETGYNPVSENMGTTPNLENGQEATDSDQARQSNSVAQVIDVSSLPADSVVILDESNEPMSEMDSALYKALKGIIGAPLPSDESVASRWQRLSESSQTSPKVSTVLCPDPPLKPDPVLVINTPAMIKYREHKNEEYLKRLHKLHSKEGTDSIICEFCGAILNSRNLANHITAFHTTDTRERRYRCELCGNAYLRHENLQRHMSTHTGAKFYCEHCGKTFQHEYSLKAHEKTHSEIPPPLPIRKPKYRTLNPRTRKPRDKTQPFAKQQGESPIVRKSKQVSCQMCGKTVSCKSLRRHLRTIHKEISHDDKSGKKQSSQETCTTCGKTVSRKSIKRHLRLHMETEPKRKGSLIVCEICGKILRKSSMKTHLETHNPKMSKCEICGKVVRKGSKYGHAKLHTDKREHSCSYCDLTFHFRSSLVAHIRKHTKERPIPCRYCEQTFPRYEARNIHERLHTGERPYKCDICQKDWRDRATYSHHMRKHHPGAPMQMKRWPPPAPTPIQSNIQQDISHDPREIKAEVSV